MFDDLFKEFGNDEIFQKMINRMADNVIIGVNNKLKFKEINIDNEVIGATLLMVIRKQVGIEFLKTVNMVLNGEDETAYANVTDFLNKIELIYFKAESNHDEVMGGKEYGK